MTLGFSGSRHGMTPWQRQQFTRYILEHKPREFHHGGCKGADYIAHILVTELLPHCTIIIHPCDIASQQEKFEHGTKLRAAAPLWRNRMIVEASDKLVATPETEHEVRRSGTWATIRHARTCGKNVEILYPYPSAQPGANPLI